MPQVIFKRDLLIDAPLDHVWQLVGTEGGLRQWWGNTIFLEAKEGGTCEEWRVEKDRASHWKGVVTLYTPPHQMMLTLKAQEIEEGRPELNTILIALEAAGDQTRVHVTQRAFGSTALMGTPLHGTGEKVDPVKQPTYPHLSPHAQLVRTPPGSIPMPVAVTTYPAGRLEPSRLLATQEYADRLEGWWQQRFTSLVIASQHTLADMA